MWDCDGRLCRGSAWLERGIRGQCFRVQWQGPQRVLAGMQACWQRCEAWAEPSLAA